MNNGVNPATQQRWHNGDQYRFVFATSMGISATSTDIATYNNFVQKAANKSPLNIGAANRIQWKAWAATANVSAADNMDIDRNEQGVSFWLTDGTLVAANNAEMFRREGNIHPITSETGGQSFRYDRRPYVWTGLDNHPLGSDTVMAGFNGNNASQWLSGNLSFDPHTNMALYGVSSLMTVSTGIPQSLLFHTNMF